MKDKMKPEMRPEMMKKNIKSPVLTSALSGTLLIVSLIIAGSLSAPAYAVNWEVSSSLNALISRMLPTPVYAAKSWGVSNEVKAKFVGTVVDITCELTGNCPDNCGAGSRQLGLKTADQGVILVSKNLTLYSGAAEELVGFCGQDIEVDGLFTETQNTRFFQVQSMRAIGDKWQKATRFHNVWAEKNNTTARKAKRWYRKDERINSLIKHDGYLGLGLDKDAEYFKK